jgi:DNA-binding transcriptional ArsR family regulator
VKFKIRRRRKGVEEEKELEEDIRTVEEALGILRQLGLVEVMSEGDGGVTYLELTDKFYELFEAWFRERGNVIDAVIMSVMTSQENLRLDEAHLLACASWILVILGWEGDEAEP